MPSSWAVAGVSGRDGPDGTVPAPSVARDAGVSGRDGGTDCTGVDALEPAAHGSLEAAADAVGFHGSSRVPGDPRTGHVTGSGVRVPQPPAAGDGLCCTSKRAASNPSSFSFMASIRVLSASCRRSRISTLRVSAAFCSCNAVTEVLKITVLVINSSSCAVCSASLLSTASHQLWWWWSLEPGLRPPG
jgi:hypothetical protein